MTRKELQTALKDAKEQGLTDINRNSATVELQAEYDRIEAEKAQEQETPEAEILEAKQEEIEESFHKTLQKIWRIKSAFVAGELTEQERDEELETARRRKRQLEQEWSEVNTRLLELESQQDVAPLAEVTINGKTYSGNELSNALNALAKEIEEDASTFKYASHVSEQEKKESLARRLEEAGQVRAGKITSASMAQRLAWKLAGSWHSILSPI